MGKLVDSKPVCTVTITDPSSELPVQIEIRKLPGGLFVGLDVSVLETLPMDGVLANPYNAEQSIFIDDDELDTIKTYEIDNVAE